MTEVMTQPKCRRCNGELTRDEKRNCWECLACYPKNRVQPAPPKEERKYIDVAMTEGRVREIVRDELENWHIQKPSVTKIEISEANKEILSRPVFDETNSGIVITEIDGVPWRQKAKELGINTFQMKKVDVLEEIKIKSRLAGQTETTSKTG